MRVRPSLIHRKPAGTFSRRGRFAAGARLRVHLQNNEQVQGHLLSLGRTSLTLVNEENRSVALSRDIVTRIDVSTGRRNHWLAGTIAGAVLGAVAGATDEPSSPDCTGSSCFTRGENIGYTAIGMGLIGALVGALLKSDRWVDVPVRR